MALCLSPQLVRDRLRQNQAVLLRAQGQTFDQIAWRLGYANRGSAYRAVKLALQREGHLGALAFRVRSCLDVLGTLDAFKQAVDGGDQTTTLEILRDLRGLLVGLRARDRRFGLPQV